MGVNVPSTFYKQRLFDQYKQNWYEYVHASQKLVSYVLFKTSLICEEYMSSVNTVHHRRALSRFRTSSHDLAIESGRYNNTLRENRLCTFCSMKTVENEYHFLLVCPLYRDVRSLYLPRYYSHWPTKQKFIMLMSSSSRSVTQKLAKYIFFATKIRNTQKSS
jgi:hypothetical protein